MLTAGVDIGSRCSKAVIIKDDQVIGTAILDTEVRTSHSGNDALAAVLKSAGCSEKDLEKIVATGYGRISAPFAHKVITEITCHARGAYHLNPNAKTIIDIGGQDSKVIRVGEKGMVDDFAMNDRCAAGTGRFIEVMARILKVDLATFSKFYLKSRKPCQISSVCTVFAESEVISLLAEKQKAQDIAKGLMMSIAGRVGGMVRRVGISEEVVFSGGVAKNEGIVQALSDELEVKIIPFKKFDPQLIGALGAALLAKNP